MIALGILLIIELFAFSWMLCSYFSENPFHYFALHWDFPAFLFVFLGILTHVLLFGKKKFLPGLRAVFRSPEKADKEIADYFWRLTVFTLLLGIIGMTINAVASLYLIPDPDVIGSFIALSIFTFSYSAWIAVMLFLPISLRFSCDQSAKLVELPNAERRFPVGMTLLGILSFFLTRALMAILLLTMIRNWDKNLLPIPPGDALFVLKQTLFMLNPADPADDLNYWHPRVFWDMPSMLLILMSVWAFYLAAGKVRNRMIWIPVCILFGILWSLEGFVIMLSDLDPTKLSAGCLVALLTAFYGLLAAILVFLGIGKYVQMFFSFLFLLIVVITVPFACFAGVMALLSGEEIPLEDVSLTLFLYSTALLLGIFFVRASLDYCRQRKESFQQKFATEEQTNEEAEEQAQQLLDSVVMKERKAR